MTTAPARREFCSLRSTWHFPAIGTVEHEVNNDMEWQTGECLHCGELIARFRTLRGGTWFDHWGSFEFDSSTLELEN